LSIQRGKKWTPWSSHSVEFAPQTAVTGEPVEFQGKEAGESTKNAARC
jgi:hypothetical protein